MKKIKNMLYRMLKFFRNLTWKEIRKILLNIREVVMANVFLLCAITSIVALLLIFLFLFWRGMPAIAEIGPINFLTGRNWRPIDAAPQFGILPMIVGSIIITAGAILLGVPVGIFTAVFLAKICPKPLYVFLKPAINLLAGIPSVVYGYFGAIVIVPVIRSIAHSMGFGGGGQSIAAASILLGIMILPVVVNISESAIRAVPQSYYEGSLALGASHVRSVFFVIVPAAKSGIFASIVLGIGRAIGETMAVVMVAGNQARIPGNIFQGVRTLTANIVMEMGYATDLHQQALIATGIILLVFILIINIVFNLITGKAKGGE